jgi:CheY-like chemotaxis protein
MTPANGSDKKVLVESTAPLRDETTEVTRIYQDVHRQIRKMRDSAQSLLSVANALATSDLMADIATRPILGAKGKRVVFIVEDEGEIASLYRTLLRRADISIDVLVARSREEALSVVRGVAFDIAVVDLRLPDGSGVDVIEAIRQRSSLLPVIVISGDLHELERLSPKLNLLAPIEVFEKTSMYSCVRRICVLLAPQDVAD